VVGGLALLALFFAGEGRGARAPMLPLGLFRVRNFAVGNGATFAVYAGLGAATFFLALFLQEVAGYTALAGGLALLPLTLMVLAFARRFGALAGRVGPRLFMGLGPLVCSVGLLLWLSLDERGTYLTQVLPGAVVFGLGLAMTVAPLTATVLGAVAAEHAGVASGVNNAIARIGSLLAIAIVGAVVTTVLLDRGGARATRLGVGDVAASVTAFHDGRRARRAAGRHLTGDAIVTFVTVPSANTGMVPIARLRA
jgi:predicted MFS family arabinose efflux permease